MRSTDRYREIEEEVLRRIKPSREEYDLVWSVYRRIEGTVNQVLDEYGVDAEVSLQGSIRKDTWISGERDLDIFVLFPTYWSREELENRGFQIIVEAAKRIGSYSIRYAEHPYVRVSLEGVEADLVPAYRISSPDQIRTAVDRTPFHTMYVIEHLPREKRDDVRLLKKFMKAIGVYGAEVRVKGFSGYLVELLVITYGGFKEVLEAASRWKPPVYINTTNLPRREFHRLMGVLRKKYPDSVVYAPDPVDPMRNVAAAVSMRSLAVFSVASTCYLRNPSLNYFFPRRQLIRFNELVRQASIGGRCMFFLVFSLHRELPPDVIWGEIDRVMDRFVKFASNFGFKPVYYSGWSDERRLCVLGFEFEECVLKEYRFHDGPPYHKIDRVLGFIGKHYDSAYAGPWIDRSGFLRALIARKYRSIYDLIIDRLNEYLVAPDFRGNPPILLSIEGLERLYILDEGFREWLVDFVLRRPAWMGDCIA